MKGIPEKYQSEYKQEIRVKTAQATWAVTMIAFLMYMPSALMDWVTYPQFFMQLLGVRLGETAALATLLIVQGFLRNSGKSVPYARLTAWILVATICVSLDFFVLIPGGPESPYYAGITLLLVAVLVSMPFDVLEMGILIGAIILQVNIVMLVADDEVSFVPYFAANYFYVGTAFIGLFWSAAQDRLRKKEFLARKELEEQRTRTEDLLLNVLPSEVAEELKAQGKVKAKHIDSCSILFTDFVGFTTMADRVSPDNLVKSLDQAFSRFDSIITKWGLEKLKTIGDAYMAAAGVLEPQPDHLVRCICAGLEMLHAIEQENLVSADGKPWRMRIGVHPGPVVAGVIGQKKFAFDLWGDTVNTASRLESSGQPHSINLATSTYKDVEKFFVGVDRGYIPVKGKGPMAMTRITRLRPEYSRESTGKFSNDLLSEHIKTWESMGQFGTRTLYETTAHVGGNDLDVAGIEPLSVFSELTQEDRDVLMRLATPIRFKAGQVLIEQGQSLKVLLLILKGVVAVRITHDAVSIELGLLHPGDVAGELSFVSWEPASATVVALEDVIALRFDMEWMESITESYPKTGIRLFHSLALVLAQRIRESNSQLFSLTTQSLLTRQEDKVIKIVPRHVPESLITSVQEFRDAMKNIEKRVSKVGRDLLGPVSGLWDRLIRDAVEASHDPELGAEAVGAYLLREVFPYFMRSPIMERIHAKPLGLAMDYISYRAIHEGPSGTGDDFGDLMDLWFLNWELSDAIRNSSSEVVGFLDMALRRRNQEEPLQVAMLASRGAPELFTVLRKFHYQTLEGLTVSCLDSDLSALSSIGQRAAKENLSDRFTYICEGMSWGRETGALLKLPPQDLILIPLMTKGFEEGRAVMMLDELHANLKVGGSIVMAHLSLPEDVCFFTNHILGWKLNCNRAVEDFQRMISQSSFKGSELEFRTHPMKNWFTIIITRK